MALSAGKRLSSHGLPRLKKFYQKVVRVVLLFSILLVTILSLDLLSLEQVAYNVHGLKSCYLLNKHKRFSCCKLSCMHWW